MVPSFSTFNFAAGMFISGLFVLGLWYSNGWNTGYLPINSNRIFDHFGDLYNVSNALDSRGMFDLEKYSKYSAPYMSAANSLVYGFFFAVYASVVTHVVLYHRYELKMGFKNLVKGMRWKRKKTEGEGEGEQQQQQTEQTGEGEYMDVHNRLMAAYPEGNFHSPLVATLITRLVSFDLISNYFQSLNGGTLASSSFPSSLVSWVSPSGRHTPHRPSSCMVFGCASCLSSPLASLLP